MKKRLLAILLALVIILGLAACAKAPEEVSGAAPEAETTNTAEEAQEAEELPDGVISTDSAKLRVMLNTSSPDRALLASEWYPKYKEAFPNFDVEFDLQSTGYPDKLAVACAGGDIPDVFWCFNSSPIETGSALDLTDLIAEDGFLNNYKIADPLRPYSDGRIYSLQTGADNYYLPTIWYNKTIFEEVGVEAGASDATSGSLDVEYRNVYTIDTGFGSELQHFNLYFKSTAKPSSGNILSSADWNADDPARYLEGYVYGTSTNHEGGWNLLSLFAPASSYPQSHQAIIDVTDGVVTIKTAGTANPGNGHITWMATKAV